MGKAGGDKGFEAMILKYDQSRKAATTSGSSDGRSMRRELPSRHFLSRAERKKGEVSRRIASWTENSRGEGSRPTRIVTMRSSIMLEFCVLVWRAAWGEMLVYELAPPSDSQLLAAVHSSGGGGSGCGDDFSWHDDSLSHPDSTRTESPQAI